MKVYVNVVYNTKSSFYTFSGFSTRSGVTNMCLHNTVEWALPALGVPVRNGRSSPTTRRCPISRASACRSLFSVHQLGFSRCAIASSWGPHKQALFSIRSAFLSCFLSLWNNRGHVPRDFWPRWHLLGRRLCACPQIHSRISLVNATVSSSW